MPITISAHHDGYRRCGVVHGIKPATYPDDRFGASQLDRLRCDPHLIVVEPVVGEGAESENAKEASGDSPAASSESAAAPPATSPTPAPEKSDAPAGKAPEATAKPASKDKGK